MPDLPISGLPVVTVPSNSYTVAAVSASVTSQMTLAQVAAAISSSFTASQAVSASYATSASYEINYETSSSYADTASFVTASNVYGPFGSNSIISASYAVSASYAPFQVSASYATTASYAESSSYALSASYAFTSVSASYAISSSNAESSSYALSASYAPISTSSSFASTASYWNGALWQLNDTQVTPTGSIADGYRLTWNSGSQKWIAAPSALQVNPVRIFVAADTSNTSAFYFNSMTRTADSSASPGPDTAFMLTSTSATSASLYLRNSTASTNGITASLYVNANGTAFSAATLVQSLSGSLTQDTVTVFNFAPDNYSLYDSLHFQITPGVGGANTYYGIVTVL